MRPVVAALIALRVALVMVPVSAGARSLAFNFGRDISRRVKWCLVDGEDGADAAFVSFIDREPARFLAKGRGPSGEWWRVNAWRGERMEPCMALRSGADPQAGSLPCFDELAEREATLAAEVLEDFGPEGDTFVYGAVGRSAVRVRVRLADNSVMLARLFRRPPGSRVRAQFFVLALPYGTRSRGCVE